MKKFLIAAAASLLIFGGQVEASTVDNLNESNVQTQEVGKWAHFRDKHILGRETENERRDRKEWERRHPPPPPPYRDSRRHHPPPPPPYRDGRHHYPPPPPPHRDGRHYNPPPTRYR